MKFSEYCNESTEEEFPFSSNFTKCAFFNCDEKTFKNEQEMVEVCADLSNYKIRLEGRAVLTPGLSKKINFDIKKLIPHINGILLSNGSLKYSVKFFYRAETGDEFAKVDKYIDEQRRILTDDLHDLGKSPADSFLYDISLEDLKTLLKNKKLRLNNTKFVNAGQILFLHDKLTFIYDGLVIK